MSYFLCINSNETNGPTVHGSCKCDTIDEAIAQWVDPMIGYVPEHMDNVAETMRDDAELTDAESQAYWDKNDFPILHESVKARVKAEAISRTKKNFGIGSEAYEMRWVRTVGTARKPKEEARKRVKVGDGYDRQWAIIEILEDGSTKTYPESE